MKIEEDKKIKKRNGKDQNLNTFQKENMNEMVEVDETRQPCSLVFIGH